MGLHIDTLEIDNLASDPVSPVEGQMWYNTTEKKLKIYCASNVDIYLGKFTQTAADPTATDDSAAGYTVSSRWINTTTGKEFVCLDATATAAVWAETTGPSADLPTVVARDSVGNADIPLTWTDLAFDQTDVENDTATVEHDNTNTDRIVVKETGLYNVSYSFECDDEIQVRVRVNDTTVINGSTQQAGDPGDINDVHSVAAKTFAVSLNANDYLTVQIQAATTAEALIAGGTFMVQRARGVKGDTGATGAGSNVTVQDEAVAVTGTPHSTLNFTGAGVTATDAGSGKVNISIPGGGGATATEVTATGTITRTTDTYALATGMTITPASGTYMVFFSTTVSNSNGSGGVGIQIFAGGVGQAASIRRTTNLHTSQTDRKYTLVTQAKVTVNGSQAIEAQWADEGSGTSSMYERTLSIVKVS